MAVQHSPSLAAIATLVLVEVASGVAWARLPVFTSAVALRDPAPQSGVHISGTDPVSAGSGAAGYSDVHPRVVRRLCRG